MLNWRECPAVEQSPLKMSGEWLFEVTRVPISALFEKLAGGATLSEFVEWFPGVTREQAIEVLKHVQRSLGGDDESQ
jgi:uncharacterized protein (DUF433 family)